MFIIIDAYNILKQISSTVYISDIQRKKFIQLAEAYAQRTGHTILIVFDGGEGVRPSRLPHKYAMVIYSGTHMTADEVIKQYLEHSQASETVLVSSDNQLCLCAQEHGIVSVAAPAFYNILISDAYEQLPKKVAQGPLYKFGSASSEIDTLMEQASQVIMYKNEQEESSSGRKKHMLSKKEKKMMKVLKKL